MSPTAAPLGWAGIVRLGLVQAMIGAVVVLTTSTLNRVMVVELALPALLPGLLVVLHHAVQLTRPRMGFGSDLRRRRSPWIVGGMLVLAAGGFGAAVATAWMSSRPGAGIVLATIAFALVGLGVSAAGTSLLALLAKRVDPARRASAASVVWVMMIMGLASTAGLSGRFLDPYSPERLVMVSAAISLIAVVVTLAALWRLEGPGVEPAAAPPGAADASLGPPRFAAALREVWADGPARRFTVFVFVSMIAYSAQDLILEPFAGVAFGFTPGESTQLAGVQHGGALAGMLIAALAGRRLAGAGTGSLRTWTIGGCLFSALALLGLVAAGLGMVADWPLRANVFALGVANGAFSIAAIGSMMALAGDSRDGPGPTRGREGLRMGLWGAAQSIGFAAGGFLGAAASDVARLWLHGPGTAYAVVFGLEALLFVAAARMAAAIGTPPADPAPLPAPTLLAAQPERGA